ncbi:hypothetical protein JKP88DRAFT_348975 [Tribonema minus]|uniref:Uncharacterized protein n=1 Tax=Tribonema minus TaxID=303371 RepID=A0A835YVR1_9STRA|nr:hypothetical protein JKP88DRAFT_348975 [Tribonema minus]
MQTRKKARDGSASARVMQHAELLRCMVEYLGDDKDLCSFATLSRTARDDRMWTPALECLCQEFPLPECSSFEIPEDDNLSPAAPPGFVRLARHKIINSSPKFNSDTGVLEFAFTTDSHAEFNAHCHSWRHCENHMDPSERVSAQFVDPRHAEPECFARLPAVRQWAALHKYVAAVMRRLHAPLTNAGGRANMKSTAEWACDSLLEHRYLQEDIRNQALARLSTSSAARGSTKLCVSDFEAIGLRPGSWAREAIVHGWADWCPDGSSSSRELLFCITGVHF